MKYKLLAVSTENQANIGDYIQALAAARFFPGKHDGFIQREKLKEYDGEECKVIMNGWYMHNPVQWPPSGRIHPLFVAFHINATAAEELMSDESVSYLKRHQPIGCRDYFTRDLLLSKGIEAYFSGCLTLTLGGADLYGSGEREDKCYFTDPFIPKKKSKVWDALYNTFWMLSHMDTWTSIEKIAKKMPYKKGLKKRIHACRFYRTYRKIFTEETLLNAEYITQMSKKYLSDYRTDDDRLNEASRLVRKYAKARMVVTSRIHCALPCLGVGTPVIFTENLGQTPKKACRMGGIRDFLNIISFSREGFEYNFEYDTKRKISASTVPANKDLWKPYAEALEKTCRNFINAEK